jgi:ribosomal protein L11 methyltransferase
MDAYCRRMKPGAMMILSGFYQSDIPMIEKCASRLGLAVDSFKEDKDWVAVKLFKNA